MDANRKILLEMLTSKVHKYAQTGHPRKKLIRDYSKAERHYIKTETIRNEAGRGWAEWEEDDILNGTGARGCWEKADDAWKEASRTLYQASRTLWRDADRAGKKEIADAIYEADCNLGEYDTADTLLEHKPYK